jgi:phage shock protein C
MKLLKYRRLKMTTHQKQSLRRSRRNRVLAGVCGGLGEFFGISAFWFRLAIIIAFIPGGVPGVLIYLLLWIMVPSE